MPSSSVSASQTKPGISDDPSLGEVVNPKMVVYPQRWYILFLFSLLCCHQCCVWNTWGPIASSVQAAYNWSDSTVAMIANWGTIVFVISALPTSWLIETKGLRPACILLSGFVMVGTGLRCFRFLQPDPSFFLVVSHITGILNGFTGVVVMAAPAHLSCLWFPQNERTTATSIAQAANLLGNGLSMLMGPAIVSEPDSLGTSDEDIERIRKEIDIYMFVNAGIATYIFISFCIYFPSKPPQAPTLTSGLARTDFLGGIKSLVKMKDILLITFAYSLSQGIMGVWMGVMVLNFRDLSISDKQVGYIGLASTVGQCIASVVISRFTDFFRHQMKKTLILLLMGSGSMYLLLALMNFQVLPSSFLWLCVTTVAATSLSFACCPLFFELAVEISYPVPESVVGGFLSGIFNVVGTTFLLLFFVPNIGSLWMNYVLVGSVAFGVPAVVLVKESYKRSAVDDGLINNHVKAKIVQ